ncbi:LCP family protein [Fictibacillus barbaricus]|uniref:LCP family protein n=2 Tax=Fictibacillus barbaricus TaxID=182136 RepID=A0ABS2ZJG2_9BACL|nr:LCP family protein [Fictibacillus barbaricus]MBN3546754.1 LCP family protein [Fictibacillus barbaricus]GGB43586.1 LytR family transcriptional regulator [Fictibacillus barbaricus]
MDERKRAVRRNRKKRKKRRLLLGCSFFMFVFLAIGGYMFYNVYEAANNSYSELDRGEHSKLREESVAIGKDPINILIMGIEDYSSGGGNGRTDSLMVASVNPDKNSIKMLSIPRDTYVDIEGHGQSKINHAHAYGGKELTIDTVEGLLDVPIDYYVTVNFKGFKDVIDELGGITVDVPFDFSEVSDGEAGSEKHKIYFKEGEMTLDGQEALAYVRMRKQDPRGDFGRSERQKQVIQAAIKESASVSTLLNFSDLADHIGNNIETNLSVSEMYTLKNKYAEKNIESLTLEGVDDTINGVYYYVPTEEGLANVQNELKSHLGQEVSASETTSDTETTENGSSNYSE